MKSSKTQAEDKTKPSEAELVARHRERDIGGTRVTGGVGVTADVSTDVHPQCDNRDKYRGCCSHR